MKLSVQTGGRGRRGLVASLAALLCLGLAATGASAQGEPKPTPAPDKDKLPLPGRVEIWAESRDTLEKELETVRALKSLHGNTLSVWQHDIDGQQPFKQESPIEYAIEKPNKLFMDTRDLKVFVDGQSVVVYSKFLKQYVRRPMPDIWLLRETLEQISGGQIRNIPAEVMLSPGMFLEQTLRGVKSMERTKTGDFESKPGIWITGTGIDDRQPGSIPFSFERWYSDADGLCHCIKQDWTAMYQDLADRHAAEDSAGESIPKKAPKYQRVTWTITYKRDLNPKLPPETFVFKPAEGDKEVGMFIWARPNLKEQVALIGKPAPAISGSDFGTIDTDQKDTPARPVDLSSYKGKVIVLDFWATWCGPCVAGLPSMQMIKEKYGDKIMLIGVNEEGLQGSRSEPATISFKVKRFLARRNLDIQQFDDADQKVAKMFFVNSIPCVVIIDAEGTIADIDVGYIPGKEKELIAKLDQMLAGKPLRTAPELKKMQEQVGVMN